MQASATLARADADERDGILSQIALETKNDPHARVSAVRELNKVNGCHVSTVHVKGRFTLEEALGLSRVPWASSPASTMPSPCTRVDVGLGSMLARKLQRPAPSLQDLVAQQHGRIPDLAEP